MSTRFFLFAALLLTPTLASAGPTVAFSVGKGGFVSPDVRAEPTNIMIAPGYQMAFIRAELGLLAQLGDVQNRDFDIDLRPMILINPPILPIHGRLILGVRNLTEDPDFAIGGALGVSFGLLGIEAFAEAGLFPEAFDANRDGDATADEDGWMIEGRAGVSYAF